MGDWNATTWSAVISAVITGIVAIISVIALLISRSQVRHSREELQDNRINEKVKGAIGENLLLINGLTEEARKTLATAQESAASVATINATVQSMATDLEQQRMEIDAARTNIEQSLAEARQVFQQLNAAATKAREDAQVVTQARNIVEEEQILRDQVQQILSSAGYKIEEHSQLHMFIDILASPPPDDTKSGHLFVDLKIVGDKGFRFDKSMISRLLNIRNATKNHPELITAMNNLEPKYLVVTQKELPPQTATQISLTMSDEGIHIVPVQHLESFVRNLTPTS